MAFNLRDSEPKKNSYPDGSLQRLLHEAIADNLQVVRGVHDPRIEDFFPLLERLDFTTLDQDRIEQVVVDGELSFLVRIRDSHFQDHRRRLRVANRITVTDESSPTGFAAHAIGPEEREKFMELLELVAQTPVEPIQATPVMPAAEIVENTIVKAIHTDTVACHRLLDNYFKSDCIIDPRTHERLLVHDHSKRLPSQLSTALKHLAKINGVLQECLRDPYAFAIKNGMERDEDIVRQVKSGLDRILYDANAELLIKINEFKAANRRANKLGGASVSCVLAAEPTLDEQPTNGADADVNSETEDETCNRKPDHSAEVSELGTHAVNSPLHRYGIQQAEVQKIDYAGKTVLIVHAGDPALKETSHASRDKYERARGKLHPYDMAIRTIAVRLANGEAVDALNSTTVKYVNKNRRSEPYHDILVASIKVRSANDSNVYVTFSSTKDLQLDTTELGDVPCIVVLAETDKASQLTTLQRIKGIRVAAIRARRSGIK